jgi:hypothetical protein
MCRYHLPGPVSINLSYLPSFLNNFKHTYMTMRIPLLAVSMTVAHQAMAMTYWIDSSCNVADHKDMGPAVKEAITMGSRASARLNSGTDQDFHHIYEYLMKRQITDRGPFNKIEGTIAFLPIWRTRFHLLTEPRLIRLHVGCW